MNKKENSTLKYRVAFYNEGNKIKKNYKLALIPKPVVIFGIAAMPFPVMVFCFFGAIQLGSSSGFSNVHENYASFPIPYLNFFKFCLWEMAKRSILNILGMYYFLCHNKGCPALGLANLCLWAGYPRCGVVVL